MKHRIVIAGVIAVAIAASPLFAGLSKELADTGKGPMSVYMTKDEQAAWKKLKNDDDAKEFIKLFWARRDPTPNTPQNEFVDEVKNRVKYADQMYTSGGSAGWATDRGKIHLLFGPPSRRETSGEAPMANVATPTDNSTAALNERTETWVYEKDRVPTWAGMPSFKVSFRDSNNSGTWKLGHELGVNIDDLMAKAVTAYIISPQLTKAPDWNSIVQQQAAAAAEEARLNALKAPAAKPALENQAIKDAVAAVKGGTAATKGAFVMTDEGITSHGNHFVGVQFFGAASLGLQSGQDVTFFGVFEAAQGAAAGAFEDAVKLSANKSGDVWVDRSLDVPKGSYDLFAGILVGAEVKAIARTKVNVASLAKEDIKAKLILASNAYPLTQAQHPTEPFAFGGLKVVPEGDQVFQQTESILFFFELSNPGIDATTSQPKIMIAIDVLGANKGKKFGMPMTPWSDIIEEKGVPGHFWALVEVPLATIPPNEYTYKVKLVDAVRNAAPETQATAKTEWEGKFVIVSAPPAPAPAAGK